ncbi:MAG TPA: M50 family metallopeptidase [Propioniciclava sp.]|mgnify:CR=1 FL=1|uniref:M50 family metallopeptidase n=1 Tax=Propioniciclava sp. TaxID=2038686 RepID=UPI002C37BEBC|nr:M50 family metallopeptidase [Propioniciclava sp.]HRL48758.1 M50 family metallopeptidase [Propioniciclava sp.]HRL78702.1 M50 family metallopeptidase [Propioniciclava sp.]
MELVGTVAFGLLFFVLLMASVALHEVGHMVPAKLFGVRVPQYFIGFGKTLWSRRIGETEYGIKLFPLGGFVQLLGMYPPENPRAKQTRLQRFADDARSFEWETITPADDGRLFYQQKVWKKLVIMAGGITMNLLIAFAILVGVYGWHGTYQDAPVVASVQQCYLTQQRADTTCQPGDPATPAAQAGLRGGDRIVSFNGAAVTSSSQLTSLIWANGDGPLTLVVERDGQTVTLPTVNTITVAATDPADASRTISVGYLGFVRGRELVRGGPVEVVGDMGAMTTQSLSALVQFPVKVWSVAVDVATGQPRSAEDPISIVGASVTAGQAATLTDTPLPDRIAMFASILASVNLFLALFNLVPLPPLDGGHIVGALWEGLRRSFATLTRRPDPGPVDTAKMVPIAYAVGGFLLLCGVVLIVADIVSPVKFF